VLRLPRRFSRALLRALVPLAALGLATVASGEPRRWVPIPGKCEVFFDGGHPLGPFSGRTEKVEGEFQLDPGDLRQGVHGALWVAARTLRTGDDTRDRQMWSSLGVEQYPEIRYTIESIEASFASISERPDVLLTIRGRLSIHGVEREVSFPGRVRRREEGLWVRGETRIKMSDYGIKPPRRLFFKVTDEVLVSFDLLLTDRA